MNYKEQQRREKIAHEAITNITTIEALMERLDQRRGTSERAAAEYHEQVFLLRQEKDKLKHLRQKELHEINDRLAVTEKSYANCEPGEMVSLHAELIALTSKRLRLRNIIKNG